MWSLVVVGSLALGACQLETATAPMGDTSYTTRFADVQELAVGHTVRISDVIVGTVVSIELDGYEAVVRYRIVDGRDVPPGTAAGIASTSLLGENYVQLQLPDPLPEGSIPSGSEIVSAGTGASVEELAIQLLAVTRAVKGRDLATVVRAGATALGPRGAELNALIRSLGDVTSGLAVQSTALDSLLVDAETLLAALAPEAGSIGATIDSAAAATEVLAGQRTRLVEVVQDITTLASTLDAEVLDPHLDRLDRIVGNLAPVASALERERARLRTVLERVRVATERIPTGIHEGGALSYAWLHDYVIGGQLIDARPSSSSASLSELLLPEAVRQP